jgi:DNA-binding NarL/FixJ family response regulator
MVEKARGGEQELGGEWANGERLSRRESELLRLIGHGLVSKEIASRLKLSPATVAAYRKSICRKLDLHSTASLALHAAKIYGQPE